MCLKVLRNIAIKSVYPVCRARYEPALSWVTTSSAGQPTAMSSSPFISKTDLQFPPVHELLLQYDQQLWLIVPGQERPKRECNRKTSCDDFSVTSTQSVIVRNQRRIIRWAVRLPVSSVRQCLQNQATCWSLPYACHEHVYGVEVYIHSFLISVLLVLLQSPRITPYAVLL